MSGALGIRFITQIIGNFATIIIAPIMVFIVGRKLWLEYKETGRINYIRLSIFAIFISFAYAIIPTNLYEVTPLKFFIAEDVIGTSLNGITPYSIAIGSMVTIALCMICYANQWKKFYFTPLQIFIGMIIFYFLSGGFDLLYQPYILITGIIGLIFFYITGIRLKDNGSLGLGLFFTFSYLSVIFGETIPGDICTLLIAIFGLIFALGYFHPYNKTEIGGRKI
ncbi:MAG: hypothetical protein P8Y70_01815 [Candidatus Lokiarchaeota archaeon]